MKFLPKIIQKPWGHEIWWAETNLYVGKLIHVDEGQQLSLQYHRIKDETMYCLNGEAFLIFEKDGKMVEEQLKTGESFRISALTKHRLKAGRGGCDVLEASTSEVNDVVRLEDDYGR